eukprot:TRINITY_DN31880_c0_g1_i1.p1 TRINITY_DN31880_c0_g1~~TRINITY_DN31880_c0_g1_i1.p1  ORF type:complete len:512 (-),score=78.84 TRINITY_DN31880_c0_g1_i1:37-1572(-)
MIAYRNDGWFCTLILTCRGSVIPNALLSSLPSAVIAAVLLYCKQNFSEFEHFGFESLQSSQLWAAFSTSLLFIVSFRTDKAYRRFWEGTTLLHQMWGEWFDAASCLIAFSTLARGTKAAEVADFRGTLVRLFSLLHGSALEEIALTGHEDLGYPSLDVGGLDQATLRYLWDCKIEPELNFNRVEVIIHMVQNLVVNAQDTGVLKIAPPILSRVFQTISRGQVNLANCKKITSTLFPFPYAQLIALMLFVFSIGTPAIMASICTSILWGVVFTTVPVFCLYALNLIARELELPFGQDANDLPLLRFQEHMNNSLVMLSHDNVDHVPSTLVSHHKTVRLARSESRLRPSKFLANGAEAADKEPAATLPSPALAPAAAAAAASPAAAPAPVATTPGPASVALLPAGSNDATPQTTAALGKLVEKSLGELMPKLDAFAAQLAVLSEQIGQNTRAVRARASNAGPKPIQSVSIFSDALHACTSSPKDAEALVEMVDGTSRFDGAGSHEDVQISTTM